MFLELGAMFLLNGFVRSVVKVNERKRYELSNGVKISVQISTGENLDTAMLIGYLDKTDEELEAELSEDVSLDAITECRLMLDALPVRGFEGMTVVQLKDIAKHNGFKGYSRLRKAELITLLMGTK